MDLKPEVLDISRLCNLMSELRIIRDIINNNLSCGINRLDNRITCDLKSYPEISDFEFADYRLACDIDLVMKAEEKCRYFNEANLAKDLDCILLNLGQYLVYDVHDDPEIQAIVNSYQNKLDELHSDFISNNSDNNHSIDSEVTSESDECEPVDVDCNCE